MTILIQLLSAIAGTFGFCLIFNVSRRHLLVPVLGGGLCWGVYLIAVHLGAAVFWAALIASAVVGVYGIAAAHLFRMPTTVCFIPSCVPLIPGSNLYYALSGLVSRDWAAFSHNITLLVLYAAAISVGLALVHEGDFVRTRLMTRLHGKTV